MAKFGFGRNDDHVFGDLFGSVDEVIGFAQRAYDQDDGRYFHDEEHPVIHVFSIRDLAVTEFMPSLDDIAEEMADKFFDEYPIDCADGVKIPDRKSAEADWEAFVEKHFRLPYTSVADDIIGRYDLKAHRWLKEDEYV